MSRSRQVNRYDVIVIGGGLAGLTAARDLTDSGHRVLLLEARDRLGGRTHTAPFPDSSVNVDFGGTYVARSNRFIVREMQRYGLRFAPVAVIETPRHLLGGKVLESANPVDPQEIRSFERACKHVYRSVDTLGTAATLELANTQRFDIPWTDFLDEVELEPATRDLFDSWVLTEAGRHGSELSALFPLWTTSQLGNSVFEWQLVLDSKIEGGLGALLDALAKGCTEIRLNEPVREVAQRADGVKITTDAGEVFEAGAVVVAVPVNCWTRITFDPPLSRDKQEGAALRPGSAGVKGWALVADAPPKVGGLAAPTSTRSITLYGTDGSVGSDQLVYFFTIPTAPGHRGVVDVNDRHAVQAQFDQLLPGSRVLASYGDDLRSSPYCDGSWASYVPGLVNHLSGMRRPEGRLAFATADIARNFIMWMDGAVQSGSDASYSVQRILQNS